ncbi:MAG: hypothetical protein JST00_22120 [Deltaproteobacteria bacterium]|nr:hypothetical protein [Deltaproteobacteria bacterium]
MGESEDRLREKVDLALAQASDELGLATYYRDNVRPLLRSPREGWPRCCGGGCEPCTQLLVLVAERTLAILEDDDLEPPGRA